MTQRMIVHAATPIEECQHERLDDDGCADCLQTRDYIVGYNAARGQAAPAKTIIVSSSWKHAVEIKSPLNVLTAQQVMELAVSQGVRIPEMPILIEEMPNGSAHHIEANQEIKLRDWMKFTIIAGNYVLDVL